MASPIKNDLFLKLKAGIEPLSAALDELRREDPVLDQRTEKLLKDFEKSLCDQLGGAL